MNHQLALEKLMEGNSRFVRGLRSVESLATHSRRLELAEEGQKPFAIVLSCADSRVPSELVFDCGLGELFVVRVAGNIVAPSLIGSIEFAAQKFGTELCIVMGHTQCGAITASVNAVLTNSRPLSSNIQKIVSQIEPSVRESLKVGGLSEAELVAATTKENIRNSVHQLVRESPVLSDLISENRFRIVGANYDLHSGAVQFFTGDQSSETDHQEVSRLLF